jgi:hypothetical protein
MASSDTRITEDISLIMLPPQHRQLAYFFFVQHFYKIAKAYVMLCCLETVKETQASCSQEKNFPGVEVTNIDK